MMIALALAGLSAQAAAVPLAQTSVWLVDKDEGRCVASSDFGSGDIRLTFAVRALPLTPQFEIVMADRVAAPKLVARGDGTLTLQPFGETAPFSWMSYPAADGRRILRFSADRHVWPALMRSSTLTIEAGSRRVDLRLINVQRVLDALTTCQDELLAAWGVDKRQRDAAVDAPAPSQAGAVGWFKVDDYPASALRAHASGEVIAVVGFDPDGRAASCRVVRTSGNAALDATTCSVIRARGRQVPARDGSGRAIADVSVVAINWVIPRP